MPVAYQRQPLTVTDADLAGWTASIDANNIERTDGLCPRCGHPTPETIPPLSVITAALVTAFKDDAVENVQSLTHFIDCACGEPHAGRPANVSTGCGGEWLIRITKGPRGLQVGTGDTTLLGAAKAFNEASADELSVVRGLAKSWVQGVAALLGLFSLAGLVFTATAVSVLSSGYQIAFAALASAALAAAASGTYLAYRAAFGWPKKTSVDDDVKLRAFFIDNGERTRKAARNLKLGVGSTFLSIAALGAAILILWFGTPASPPSPLVMITSTDGSRPCGTLLPASGNGSVRVVTVPGAVITLLPRTLVTLTTVAKCPG